MEDREITVTADVPAISDSTLIQLAEQAEARVAAMQKIKKVALKMTNPTDWVDQNGKPYLQASGAEKVARLFGISWQIDEPVPEHEDGGHYNYTYKGYFSLAGATIEAVGTRSSKDGFFKKYGYENGQKTELPPSAIDKGDVKKSAYTNLLANGITRILGLRNLSYGDLEEFAGITKEMVERVEYKKSGGKREDIASEGATDAVFVPTDVRQSSGTNKAGKQWTKYTIKDQDTIYNTFSKSFAEVAKDAKAKGLPLRVIYKSTKYGNDVEKVEIVEPPIEESREPGQEG